MASLFYHIKNICTKTIPKASLGGSPMLRTSEFVLMVGLLFSCSTTSHLEDGEQLYTGLKPIEYESYESGAHFDETQLEVEAALATAPNGALFGSSYYRTPFPYGLWIYNALDGKKGAVPKWLVSTFGKAPVLMSNVNPELRLSVAENVLQNRGYFRGNVDYAIEEGKPKTTKTDTVPRPRTAKIAYKVNLGHLFTIDTMSYSNFASRELALLKSSDTYLSKGTPFCVSTLDNERARIYNLLRNHGYYFYQQSYASFLADTLKVSGAVQVMTHLADSLPEEVMKKWVIGRTDMSIRRTDGEVLTDTVTRRFLTLHYAGKKSPLRPRVVLGDVKMRPGNLFSQDNYEESMSNLITKGIFSSVNLSFKPRRNADGTYMTIADSVKSTTRDGQDRAHAGVLDMEINCVLDKPYDVSFQANYLGKTSGRMGPGAQIGFAKRNAFRGGELLSLNLAASCEFQLGSTASSNTSNYEISGDLSLAMPRLWLPSFLTPKRRWYRAPSTMISIARETVNRSGFFRRHILSAELSYTFQPSAQSTHKISPLILSYDRMASSSLSYDSLRHTSAVMMASSGDYFLPKMRYTYTYTSPRTYRNPITMQISVTEAANIMSLGYLAFGKKWNDKGKTAFKTPYSQFLKLEAEWRKTWDLGEHNSVVAHTQLGILKCFGNSEEAPFTEYFYVGGANNLRGFPARSLGPGRSHNPNSTYSYATNVGDLKFVANLEYRPHLFGSLYGAAFVDVGNIWNIDNDGSDDDVLMGYDAPGARVDGRKFKASSFLNDLAMNVGLGVRYDMDFFVLRLDWGFALHKPYDTGRSGYFNVRKFSEGSCINFAIGYPF